MEHPGAPGRRHYPRPRHLQPGRHRQPLRSVKLIDGEDDPGASETETLNSDIVVDAAPWLEDQHAPSPWPGGQSSETNNTSHSEQPSDGSDRLVQQQPEGWSGNSPNTPAAPELEGQPIPAFHGYRPPAPSMEARPPTRRVVRRDEGLVEAINLPTISCYNMRSIWAKIGNLADDINMRGTDICFLSEVWEKKNNRRHQYSITEMMEMKGISYISTPRLDGRRGGGVAIAYSGENFLVSKLNIEVKKPLECLFALLKPRNKVGKTRKIIAICFYSPPKSKSNTKLVDLLASQISSLRTQYEGCGIILCGDRNDLSIQKLLSSDPALRQIVTFNTNKNQDKTLDVVCTDVHSSYQEPNRLPAIMVDQGREGVPSDHWGVEVRPRTNTSTSKARPKKEVITVRRMPDSLVAEFGPKLAEVDWSVLLDGRTAEECVKQFHAAANRLVEQQFPTKQVTIMEDDLPYFTEVCGKLRRQRDNAYKRGGKSETYFRIQNDFQNKLVNESSKYKNKIIAEVNEGKRGSGYSAVRKLGESKADREKKKQFTIPAFIDEGLTSVQAANRLADHFSEISQTVAPLNINNFSPALRLEVETGKNSINKPVISQHDVYRKLLRIKKPNYSVEGDIPKKLIQEYSFLWAGPSSIIFNKIIQTADWPKTWKTEHSIVLHKTEKPSLVKSEDDTRTISKTNFMSKVLESLLAGWLLPAVEPYLDPGQCGGLSRSSTSHYLIKLLNFVHTTVDQQVPHAVVMAALDLSKAYNRGDSMVIEDLHAMHVPGWLLALLCSYLTSRTMELSYLGATSTTRDLPGGYGAGTWLGGFLFIVKFNGICLRPSIPRPSGNTALQLKYIDDASKAASINLKKSLIPDTQVRPQPLNFHEASGKIIDPQENVLQHELDRFQRETTQNNFVTNKKKTMVMVFNNSKNHTFIPEFRMGDSEILSVKKELKVLGVMVQDDLKWDSQVKLMVGKASAKIWLLRRMKQMGVDEITITSYWKSEGLVHLEHCAPVWSGGINIGQANDLQRTQMRAVAAITGGREDYTMACLRLGLEPNLSVRRTQLCLKFARRTATASRHTDLFTRLENPRQTRGGGKEWREPPCRTRRHLQSAVPHLTRLLNGEES